MKPYDEYRAIQEQVLDFARSNGHTDSGNVYAFAFGYVFAGLTDDQLDELERLTRPVPPVIDLMA